MSQHDAARRLAWRIFLVQQANLFTSVPCALYIFILVAQIPREQLGLAMRPVPWFILGLGILAPLVTVHLMTRQALATYPNELPGARLRRILKLPRALEVVILFFYVGAAGGYLAWLSNALDKPFYIVPWGTSVILVLMMLVMIWTRTFLERTLMPYALEEFLKSPESLGDRSEEQGLLWPRQSWYQPYSFALFILCTVATMGTILARMGLSVYQELTVAMPPEVLQRLNDILTRFLDDLTLPLLLVGLFMLVSSALSAVLLTRHQQRGFRAIHESIEGLANGKPKVPSWVTTDEIGDLARSTARAFQKLRQFSLSLAHTASNLGHSAESLGQANTTQGQALTRQASALHEAQVTAQEIHQTSRLASDKVDAVLRQTASFEDVGRAGETAIRDSIQSLQEIRSQVGDMARRIRQLSERAQQIDTITRVVKDLADRSNMLAVNAAIEAVRSGDHGKGFGVVAREIRTLADQSSKAANNVREMLSDLATVMQETANLTEAGAEKVNGSVEQVRSSGESLRKLSSLMQENVIAVRQISSTVSQQALGIRQIFQAISDLNTIMNETLGELSRTTDVTREVRQVATEVDSLVHAYGWEQSLGEASGGRKGTLTPDRPA